MNLFTISGLLLFFTSSILVIIILKFGKTYLHRVWVFFNMAVAFWGISCYFIGREVDLQKALILWRISQVGVSFIAVFLYHVVYLLCNLNKPKFLFFVYLQGVTFSLFSFSPLFYPNVRIIFSSFYYALPGPAYHFFTIMWMCIVFYSHYLLLREFGKSERVKKNQILYFFFGSIVGFSGGITNFLVGYGIKIYPFGNFTIPIYCIIVTYAIIRYRLMDISLAITRTGIFVAVYSLILGIPFVAAHSLKHYFIGLFGENWWMAPLILSTILATVGPFIYLYIQHRAEDRLLREQRRYQQTLRQASVGMTRVKDLQKLLNLIVHIVTRTVRLKHGSIYLLNDKSNQYELRAIRDKGTLKEGFYFDANSALVWNLILEKEPIVYEEVKQKMQDYKDEKLALLEQEMRLIDAAVVVPSFVEEKLLGFIVLGEKLSGKIYSQDDLSVFSVLANQAALAIENAEFYEDIKETQTQLFQAEKMTTIGTMADGLSHQINNRFHALGMISADALDALKSINENSSPQELKAVFEQLNHALERVKENVKQGGEVVHSLLKYSRAGEAGFEPVDLDTLINSSLEMAQYKVKLSQIDLFRDYTKDIPKIKGNFTQLQEVFFNLIDNAYDAVVQRRTELQEPDYRGNVTIQAVAKDSKIEIRFIDNGMGVKESEKERLFTPFFTTKTSSKKGTGLGLYVIQKIIVDNHKGKIFCESEYKTGTMFVIELPVA